MGRGRREVTGNVPIEFWPQGDLKNETKVTEAKSERRRSRTTRLTCITSAKTNRSGRRRSLGSLDDCPERTPHGRERSLIAFVERVREFGRISPRIERNQRPRTTSHPHTEVKCLSRRLGIRTRPAFGAVLRMVETPGEPVELAPVDTWIGKVDFRSTAEVKIPERLVIRSSGKNTPSKSSEKPRSRSVTSC